MASLRDRWRSGRSAFLVLAGCVVAVGGNAALIAWAALTAGLGAWPVPIELAAFGTALSVLMAWIVAKRPPRTAKHFASVAVLATAIALLTIPGLIGGGLALAGALLGMLAAYEGLPEASRG